MPLIRNPVPRTHGRKIFAGYSFAGEITVKRGCYKRLIDKLGDVVADKYDAAAVLWSNLGDKLVVSAKDLAVDQVAIVEIVSVSTGGFRFGVIVISGRLAIGDVWVMQGRKHG